MLSRANRYCGNMKSIKEIKTKANKYGIKIRNNITDRKAFMSDTILDEYTKISLSNKLKLDKMIIDFCIDNSEVD